MFNFTHTTATTYEEAAINAASSYRAAARHVMYL